MWQKLLQTFDNRQLVVLTFVSAHGSSAPPSTSPFFHLTPLSAIVTVAVTQSWLTTDGTCSYICIPKISRALLKSPFQVQMGAQTIRPEGSDDVGCASFIHFNVNIKVNSSIVKYSFEKVMAGIPLPKSAHCLKRMYAAN